MRQYSMMLSVSLIFATVLQLGNLYNPDIDLDTAQIIRRHGYPTETHSVVTEDGYILAVHRILGSKDGKRGGQPVFLQHGLLSSSSDWVSTAKDSLAFILADLGYDVWLGNARGNTYSTAHLNLSIHSAQYWNFTWHEMGIYDLPAVLYHVSNVTSKPGQIIYIGHSMGNTQFFVMATTRPQAAKNVKLMIALAPPVYMAHVTSPIRYLAPFSNDIEWLAKYLGVNDFLPNVKLLSFLSFECRLLHKEAVCNNVFFLISGLNEDEFNMPYLPVAEAHVPAGSSAKTIIHYAQEIRDDGNFQQFNYGPEGNRRQYGTLTPPLYKLENVKVRTYLTYAMGDQLVNHIDVLRLAGKLSNNVGVYKVPMDSFDHVDFVYGKNVTDVLYRPIIKLIQNYTEDFDF